LSTTKKVLKDYRCTCGQEAGIMLLKLAQNRGFEVSKDHLLLNDIVSVYNIKNSFSRHFNDKYTDFGPRFEEISIERYIQLLLPKFAPYTCFYFMCNTIEQENCVDLLLKGRGIIDSRISSVRQHPFMYASYSCGGAVTKFNNIARNTISFEEGLNRLLTEGKEV